MKIIIEVLAAQKSSWRLALGELINNALDARATTITIVVNKGRYVSITDNGAGCPNPIHMVVPGDRISGEARAMTVMLPETLRPSAKARRRRKKEPTGTGTRHRRARHTQPDRRTVAVR